MGRHVGAGGNPTFYQYDANLPRVTGFRQPFRGGSQSRVTVCGTRAVLIAPPHRNGGSPVAT